MLKELTTLFIDLSLRLFCFVASKKGVINNHRIEPQRNWASINDSTQSVRWYVCVCVRLILSSNIDDEKQNIVVPLYALN